MRRGAGWGRQPARLRRARGRAPWGSRARAPRGSPGAGASRSAPVASASRAARPPVRLGDQEEDAASAGPGPNDCGRPGAGEPSAAAAAAAAEMDQCVTVERELEKVLHKFSGYGQLCERGLEELIDYTGGLKHEILQSHGRAARVGARGPAHRPRPRPPLPPPQARAGRKGRPRSSFPASPRCEALSPL